MVSSLLLSIPRIEALLNEKGKCPFLLIEAPAGFGKTTQCLSWVERLKTDTDNHIIWLNRRYHDQIASAISKVSGSKTRWLFIDDFHELSPEVQHTYVMKFRAQKRISRLVVVRRPKKANPQFPSLRISGEMGFIGSNELALTLEESRKFLKCSRKTASSIYQMTFGWPCAMPFFKQSTVNEHSDLQHIAKIDLELFWQLIREEVLDELTFKPRDTIFKLTLMDDFQFEDATHLLSISSDELIAIIRSLSPIWVGSPKTGFMHPAVRYVLTCLAWETSPKLMEDAHLQFSKYYWRIGDLVTALTHASKSGKTEYVCELIEQAGGIYLWINEGLERIREVMAFTDESLISSYPRLLLIKALLHVKEGRLTQADQAWTEARIISEGFTKARPGGDIVALKNESALLGSLLAGYGCHSLEEQVSLAQPHLLETELKNQSDAQLGYTHTLICLHSLQNGNFEAVRKHATLSETAFERIGSDYGILYLNFHRGGAAYGEGLTDEARMYYSRAEKRRRKLFPDDRGLKFIAKVFTAEIDLETASFLSVKRKLSGLKRNLDDCEAWFDVYVAALRSNCYLTYLAKGYERACSETYDLGAIAKTKGLKRVERFADVLRLELACRAQDRTERDRLAAKLCLKETLKDPDVRKYVMWREYVCMLTTHALYLRHTQQHRLAIKYLTDLHQYGGKANNKVCQVYALSELVLHDSSYAGDLYDLMRSTGYILPLKLSDGLRAFSLKHSKLDVMRMKAEDEASKLHPRQAQSFTSREKEVIRHLAQSMSDKEIAIELGISVHTVRFHMKNIFTKTGAHDRQSVLQTVQLLENLNELAQ